jgi:hypothetical protein
LGEATIRLRKSKGSGSKGHREGDPEGLIMVKNSGYQLPFLRNLDRVQEQSFQKYFLKS